MSDELGRGRSAIVRRHQRADGTSVARKTGPDPDALRREHEALERCRSPRVVRSLGLAEEGHALDLALIEGGHALAWIRDATDEPGDPDGAGPRRNLPVAFGYDQQEEGVSAFRSCGAQGFARLEGVLTDLADALAAVHAAGLVHLDVCADNVLLREGHAVLIDFDLARPPGSDVRGALAGRAATVAPELGRGVVDTAGDWYGLGVFAFEAASGQLPFGGGGGEVLVRKQTLTAPRLSEVLADVPAALDERVAAWLHRSPLRRRCAR